MNDIETKHAAISWVPSDLLDISSGLTYEQCEQLMAKYESLIRDAMVRAGWDVIEQIADPAWRESMP